MTTQALLERWHAGDHAAFSQLLERHLPAIRERAHLRLGPLLRRKDETADVVQDAVVQFLRYGPRFVVESDEQLRALLFRIVENVLRDKHDWYTARRRSLAKEKPLSSDTVLRLDPPVGASSTPSQASVKEEREAWVRLGLELLDPEERNIIVLRLWDDLPFEEIGRGLGVAADAARMRFHRAVAQLSDKVVLLRTGDVESAARDGESPAAAG